MFKYNLPECELDIQTCDKGTSDLILEVTGNTLSH